MLGGDSADGVLFVFAVKDDTMTADNLDAQVAPEKHKDGLAMLVATLTRLIQVYIIGGNMSKDQLKQQDSASKRYQTRASVVGA